MCNPQKSVKKGLFFIVYNNINSHYSIDILWLFTQYFVYFHIYINWMNARASASHPTHKSIHSHSHSISVLYVCVVDVRECITSVYCNSGPHTHTLGRITHVCLYADMHMCTQTQPCTPHIHRTTTNGRGLEINSFVDAYTLISTRYTDFFCHGSDLVVLRMRTALEHLWLFHLTALYIYTPLMYATNGRQIWSCAERVA